jgi:hypothetical protein
LAVHLFFFGKKKPASHARLGFAGNRRKKLRLDIFLISCDLKSNFELQKVGQMGLGEAN